MGGDWRRLDETGGDWTRLDETGGDWTGLDETGGDWTGLEETGRDWRRLEQAGGGWRRLDRTGGDLRAGCLPGVGGRKTWFHGVAPKRITWAGQALGPGSRGADRAHLRKTFRNL